MKWALLLLLLTVLITVFVAMETFWTVMAELKLRSNMQSLMQIGKACTVYANVQGGPYPEGTTSNEALRQLFIAGIIDDEALFNTNETDRENIDGNIGTAENRYLQALAPGECRFNYIRELLAGKSESTIPLIHMQIAGYDGEVWMLSYTEGAEGDLRPTTNGAVLREHNGRQVDIFSPTYLEEKYDILPQDILQPEGPVRDVIAIARERKMKIRLIESAILTAILLPSLLIYRIKHRRKPQPHPETPTPQA